MNREKYEGIFPAFYACYDDEGEISVERVKALTKFHIEKGVKGVYVGGSSGECIYQSVAERKLVLESVMEAAEGKLTIIAHVACGSTKDSIELAKHAESVGVDAIAAIPPQYYRLKDWEIANYWNSISYAAPNTDMVLYNIPQLTGVELNVNLLREMKKNPKVIGVKNSSMPISDISKWVAEDVIVWNGPDEQLAGGLMVGAIGGIGGTYGAMPELYVELHKEFKNKNIEKVQAIQADICKIISIMRSGKAGNYAIIKGALKLRGVDVGSVRPPFGSATEEDKQVSKRLYEGIEAAVAKHVSK